MERHEPGRSANGTPVGATLRSLITSPAASALAVGSAAAVVFVWMRLAAPSASPDAWAYSAWGQALARGERPDYALSATLPKPLATVLATIVSPLPAPRGMTLVVAVGLAIALGAMFFLGARASGAVGAAIAVVAFLMVPDVALSFRSAHIDLLITGLVTLGVALSGVSRVVSWGLAGLLRPEAWLLSAMGGFTAASGSRRRKVAFAALAAILPAAVWIGFDLLTAGDPLATVHWRQDRRALIRQFRPPETGELPTFLYRFQDSYVLIPVAVVGLLGLSFLILKAQRGSRLEKAIPLISAAVWLSALAVERHLGQSRFHPRYVLPVVAMLAVGCGFLAGALVRTVTHRVPIAAGAAVAVAAVGVFAAGVKVPDEGQGKAYLALEAGIGQVLACGRLGVTGDERTPNTIVQLIAASRKPASRFEFILPFRTAEEVFAREDLAGVLRVKGEDGPLPSWRPRVQTPFGTLAIRSGCEVGAGATSR